jgi:hypothetical protein
MLKFVRDISTKDATMLKSRKKLKMNEHDSGI